MVHGSKNCICQLSEAILNLPPELQEMIYNKMIAIKIKQRELGLDELHKEITNAPFCDKCKLIIKMWCPKCDNHCDLEGLCYKCLVKGEKLYI